jgi:hypothetical protein
MAIDKRDEEPVLAGPATRSFSPPCALPDADPVYSGYLPTSEIIDLLNVLLEGERAGARGINEVCLPLAAAAATADLRAVALDEGRFCTMLYRHIVRLGGVPSTAIGDFVDKLAAVDAFDERLALLNRGQAWVVRKLRAVLPRIADSDLRADLAEMLVVHERNIERCALILAEH